jgi:hypothetical protein
MASSLEEVTQEAVKLPRQQRLALAGVLLELDRGDEADAEAAWEHEILARIQAIDEGTATGVSYEEAMRAAEDRLAT